jgi:hypothetical protein
MLDENQPYCFKKENLTLAVAEQWMQQEVIELFKVHYRHTQCAPGICSLKGLFGSTEFSLQILKSKYQADLKFRALQCVCSYYFTATLLIK